ncbi:U4/U6 small nuclear ribonucleoprotein Prp31 [Thelohanellus kitauei]|uniref:U4/U6 small nuclear ribonucleoprotein Prp31 n=1 Tax=Thelohanellus kitauei TaxID=669202 RepID=A0A0C2ML47_THEKT|nr:U4/U6 small nuclear ribonucleoprotein Prp31 [Thelohanellus kitauei]
MTDEISKIDVKKSINCSILKNSHPEYQLDVKPNSWLLDVDTEINILYKFLRDIYNKRFSELEFLVASAPDYMQTVFYLGNVNNDIKLDGVDFLPPAIKRVKL